MVVQVFYKYQIREILKKSKRNYTIDNVIIIKDKSRCFRKFCSKVQYLNLNISLLMIVNPIIIQWFLRRSRSRSPSESKTRLPEELKKHLEFELVETDGMTEEQLREIPYTAVKTSLKSTSPPLSSKRKTYSSRRAKRSIKIIYIYYVLSL